jgi:hypothetical protein
MYNAEQKMRFIQSRIRNENKRQPAVDAFDAFAALEEERGADLCTLPKQDLMETLDSLAGIRNQNQWKEVHIIQDYLYWCVDNKIPRASRDIFDMMEVGLENLRKRMVASPLHLQRVLDQVFDPEEEKTIDNVYRSFLWMAYGGMDRDEALLVTDDAVAFKALAIRWKGESYPLYREALPAIENCIELETLAVKRSDYTSIQDRIEGDRLLRGVKANSTAGTLLPVITKRVKQAVEEGKTDVNISYNQVWISGLFYRMYEQERAGDVVDFIKAAEKTIDDRIVKKTQAEKPVTDDREGRIYRTARDYKNDYQRWKRAFEVG